MEYSLPGVNQVQMKSEIGLDFSASLRAFLRQDPDIIMVGEIRDLETAEIAIKAALTGHMVLSTLHTNSAPDTISRLLNMGVAPFNLVAALRCITAQRLMKKICEHCKEEDPGVSPKILVDLGVPANYASQIKGYRGAGCGRCSKSGYKGRWLYMRSWCSTSKLKKPSLMGPRFLISKISQCKVVRTLRQSALFKLPQECRRHRRLFV